jgi:protein-export membrane protein SecD/preprotein translocase SecF subunit
MHRRLRWKLAVILAVVVGTSAIAWFPPLAARLGLPGPAFLARKGLRLGLDLRGGVQFVLRVNADEALGKGTTATRDEIVAQVREAIDRRVNALGVTEPLIAVQGDRRDQILVQLPGYTDTDRARAILGATARLEWRLVEAGPSASREALQADATRPEAAEVLAQVEPSGSASDVSPSLFYLVKRTADVGGSDIRRAWATRDEFGRPAVAFSLTADGARRFAELTSHNIGRQVAIVLDDRVQSAPVIDNAITNGEGVIRGGFSAQEAADFALLLRAGALPVSMTVLGGQYVGPTLGASSVRAGLAASVGGLILVAAFMLVYYRRAGVNAVVSVVANLAMLLGVMASLGAAMTLPGIAGLILTIGMGVDSNVLIFERIKEELRAGQSIRKAIAAGFDRVFLTILDTHVATLVAAAFLFQFGSGSIRGFATTLSLGLLINLFTAVFVSRTIFELTLSRGHRVTFGSARLARLWRRARIDVMSHRTAALWVSAAIVAAGVTLTMARGLPLGLDFTGGTDVVAQFDGPVNEEAVRQAIPETATVQRYGPQSDHALQIRVPHSASAGDGDVEAGVGILQTALHTSGLPASRIIGTETIEPSIGRDLQTKGAYAMAGALAGITAYLALRFRPSFATGAAVAVGHDIVVTVAMLSLCGYGLDLNVVAALLTVAGYSVNDTIVIFDRVRERLRTMGRGAIDPAVNTAVAEMLGRTVITSGTTFAAVLALYLFGGTVLHGFAFTVLVGVVVGTWSSVFVAAPVAALAGRGRRATA